MKKKSLRLIPGLIVILGVLFLIYPTGEANVSIANPAGKPLLQPPANAETFVPERAGYYETAWPSEHADLWRSHAALDSGLPANFEPEQLRVASVNLELPVWGYTRDKDEVFVIGGSPFVLNSFTQAIKNGQPLGGLESIGSTLADVVNPIVPYLAKINPLTMQVAQVDLTGGSTVNYTGGLLIHENGFVYAVSQSILHKVDPRTLEVVARLKLPPVGDNRLTRYWTTYNGMQVLASGELVVKGFHLMDSANIPGWLLLIDPDDLAIDVQQSTAVSSARLTLQQGADGKTYLYHVNAIESLRFEITNTGFELDEAWTRRYRAADAASTQASSPLLFGGIGQVAFADNTAPGATTPIQLYTQPMDINHLPEEALTGVPAFTRSIASFNFFMVAGDPFDSQILVYYDPINNLLAAHRVGADGRLELL